MSQAKTAPVPPSTAGNGQHIPPLENGATLSVVEFERRYGAMSDVKKAELIDGAVYMPSPVSFDHSGPHAEQMSWLATYKALTPGVEVGDIGTLRLRVGIHQPQPDGYLRILPAYGGQSRNSADHYRARKP
ncbi:MAG: hypothetical protein ACJ8F7_01265 [Gemmataceae bacterium]